MKRSIAVVIAFLTVQMMQAQYYEVGLGGFGTIFHGDVGAVGFKADGMQGFTPADGLGSLTFREQHNWHWSTRYNYSRGYLTSSDSWSTDDFKLARDIDFRTQVDEFAFMTEFNFWPYGTGTKNFQSFYIFTGIGLTYYHPQGYYNDQWYDLRSLGTEGQQTDLNAQLFYGRTTITLPMGMGYRRSVSRDLSFTTEIGWRRYGSDYLDDTSGDYVNTLDLAQERNQVAAYFANPGNVPFSEGSSRGNANTKDWAIFAGVSIFYNLSSRHERCRGF